MKHFYVHQNIGKARYVLNIHTDKRHTDGSLFYDVEILKSRKKLNDRIQQLKESGYKEK